MPGLYLISKRQSEMLLNYMEQNPWLAGNSRANTQMKKRGWARVAFTLNSASVGCKRSPESWCLFWNELVKHVVRRKVFKNSIPLTDKEERVLAIAGRSDPNPIQYIQNQQPAENSTNRMDEEEPLATGKQAESEYEKNRQKNILIRENVLKSASPEMSYLIRMNERSLAVEEHSTRVLIEILKTVRSINTVLEAKLLKPASQASQSDDDESDDNVEGDDNVEVGGDNVEEGADHVEEGSDHVEEVDDHVEEGSDHVEEVGDHVEEVDDHVEEAGDNVEEDDVIIEERHIIVEEGHIIVEEGHIIVEEGDVIVEEAAVIVHEDVK